MFDQILDLVGQPPGSLVYHFVILFAVEAALAISIGQWMREREAATLRLAVATFVIFCGRVAMLIASLAAWQGYLPYNVLLPPVERLVDTVSVLAIAWAFVTMDDPEMLRRNFSPDVIAMALLVISFIAFGGTYYYWTASVANGLLFNGLWLDAAWSIAQITVAVVGLVWLLARIRYVYDPFLKGIMLVLLAAAPAAHIVHPALGDVAAAVRLSQILVMPMLAAVAYRHVVEQLLHWDTFEPSRLAEAGQALAAIEGKPEARLEEAPESGSAALPEAEETVQRRRPAPAPEPEEASGPRPFPVLLEVVEAVGGLLSTLEPSEIVREAPRAIATALRADICVLAIVDEAVQQAAILGGYDNIAQTQLPQSTLDLADHPTIVNALGRLRQMRLTPQRNLGELRDIYERLQITHEGPAYIQPLVNGEERVGVLLVGSPYSGRLFSNDERNLLDRLGPLVTAALLNAEAYKDAQELTEATSAQDATRLVALSDELTAKTSELNAAQRQIEEMKLYIRDLLRQVEEAPQQQQAAQEQIERLLEEVERLRQQAGEAAALRAEVERLREASERAQALESEVSRQRQQVPGEAFAAFPLESAFYPHLSESERRAVQGEIATLRARLAQATIAQQEVNFLQEQLAAKARETVMLQTRLSEAQAVADALREQVSSGVGSSRQLEVLQARVAAQAATIAQLEAELAEARAVAGLDEDTLRAQQEVERIDREAMAQLEAQLVERSALIEALEGQLAEKVRAIVELKLHMEDVNAALHKLEEQLGHKTEEVAELQESLARARDQAQERIASLEGALKGDEAGQAAVDQARVEALEAELAEKAAAIAALEEQLARTQQSMAELEQQLSATNEAVDAAISDARRVDHHDEVIASIAQELRTPMSSIMGYTELLLRESVGILGSLQRKFLQRVKANTERMGTLLDDLIRITSLDMGQLQLEPEKVDVFFAVEEVIMSMTNQLSEKGLTLRLATPDELPPIVADREALTEIVRHLLLNAALASPVEGEVRLAMGVTEGSVPSANGDQITAECLKITVEDTGVGISLEDQERVFMRKYRADNPLIEGLGDTGVGLALTKALVEAQGGRIWMESEKNVGTAFHILIPLEPVQQGGKP